MYTKFENNPSRGFWVIALTPLRAAGGGRWVAGGGRLWRKTITSPNPSDTGDIIRDQYFDPVTRFQYIAWLRSTWRLSKWIWTKLTSKFYMFYTYKLFQKNEKKWNFSWTSKNFGSLEPSSQPERSHSLYVFMEHLLCSVKNTHNTLPHKSCRYQVLFCEFYSYLSDPFMCKHIQRTGPSMVQLMAWCPTAWHKSKPSFESLTVIDNFLWTRFIWTYYPILIWI